MDAVYSWAMTVTVCAVISSIAEMLTNGSRITGTVRLVLGLFMLSAVMMPFMQFAVDFRLPEISADSITESAGEQALEKQKQMICEKLRELTEKTLARYDIYPDSVDIELDIDDKDSIRSITAVVVMPAGSGAAVDEAAIIVKKDLGIECTVRTSSVR